MSTPTDSNSRAEHQHRNRTRPGYGALLAFTLLALLCLVATLQAGVGYADQMTVFSCHDPAGNPVGTDGWTTERTGGFHMIASESCAGGGTGAFDLELAENPAGYPNGASVQWVFNAPAWATIASYELQIPDSYAVPPSPGGEGQAVVYASDESDPVYDYRNLGFGSVGAGVIARTPPDTVRSLVTNASCDGASGNCPAEVTISSLQISATRIVLNDGTTPTVSSLGGPLVSGSPQRGESEISFDAADSGPGVYSAHLVVDGKPQPATILDSNNGWCENLGQTSDGTRSFAHPDPCAASLSTGLALNTAQLPDGTHAVKLIVEDASGDSTIGWSATVTTQNAPVDTAAPTITGQPGIGSAVSASPGTWSTPAGAGATTYTYQWQDCNSEANNCQPIPGAQNATYTPTTADAGHTLRVQVTAADNDGASSATSAATSALPAETPLVAGLPTPGSTTGSGTPNGTNATQAAIIVLDTHAAIHRAFAKRAFTLTGRLTTMQSQPIAGASLDVLAQNEGASTPTLIAYATTSPTGAFTVNVPAGPSRLIEVAYRANTSDSAYAATARVQETVAAGVHLHATTIIPGPNGTIRITGRVSGPIPHQGTLVQILVHWRGHWELIRNPRTHSDGTFHVAYQFQGDIGTFPFRAEIPTGQAGFPYTRAYSNTVTVATG